MSTKRKRDERCHTSSTVSVSNPSASISPFLLPEEIILFILKRLPVKSILRFNWVCKDWLSLLSTPNFISIHLEETSKNPLNHSFLISSVDEDDNYSMSLLNFNFAEREPISHINPFPLMFRGLELVGSINGLVCLCSPPSVNIIILWNPAMNLCKEINLESRDEIHSVALGFAYDSVNDDYKIIRISFLRPKRSSRAEVYSAGLDSLESIHTDLPFVISQGRGTHVVVKGIPYWSGYAFQANDESKFTKILVYYDVQNRTFKHVSLSESARDIGISEHAVEWKGNLDSGISEQVVEWKGNLGMIVSPPSKNRFKYFVDIKVYDEMGLCWKKISSHGPIGLKMKGHMLHSKNGVILAETSEGMLILYDTVTNRTKTVFCVYEVLQFFIEAFSYGESLVTIKGMERVMLQDIDVLDFS